MTKPCNVCGYPLNEGDTVVALCVTKYHKLPSRIAYAIDPPQECIDVMHFDCRDKSEGGNEHVTH